MRNIILAFPGMEQLAKEIADEISADWAAIDLHRFPDGETLVTLPEGLAGRSVAILATLRNPDALALPLRFAAETAREFGAHRVGLIAPYLAYMRQDRRLEPGQAVSAPLFASFLEESFDWLLTVDPHLHRIPELDRIFDIPARRVTSSKKISEWIALNVPDAIVLGPDSESQQWVSEVARLASSPYEVLHKSRSGDRTVDISVPESGALLNGTPVIVDDIASSGRTIVAAIARLREIGARPPVCIIIHAVFASRAFTDIQKAGAARIVTTNSIPHESNAISLSPCIKRAVSNLRKVLDLPSAGTLQGGSNGTESGQET
ncbi:ribose-phosphate diphosphokinase [Vannielia litorea]|uniref:ribose-phosphate diphosphokinase n=1 Tax=Vannielia litorea TaxID=1217970 RepID=UPI001BCB3D30|nr:ribose-phosphate diphosphokinase [Vannielia litorea]MBS8226064.1 ribose-phosphate diphosphokinase [Vannielia litorea]